VWRNIVAKFKLDIATASPNTFANTEAIRKRIIVFEKVEAIAATVCIQDVTIIN
jgi:hypothetical protein